MHPPMPIALNPCRHVATGSTAVKNTQSSAAAPAMTGRCMMLSECFWRIFSVSSDQHSETEVGQLPGSLGKCFLPLDGRFPNQ